MEDQVNKAKAAADRLRFSADVVDVRGRLGARVDETSILAGAILTGIQITPNTLPELHAVMEEVCRRLDCPSIAVKAFVYPDSNIGAQCQTVGYDSCVLRFSSGLVNLLSLGEFAFVAGHEVGHFLLGHGANSTGAVDNAEFWTLKRAAEISADRIALIAAADINNAVRAIMKSASGLNEDHLRFDVLEFMSQVRRLAVRETDLHSNLSHPSLMVRCRALLSFATLMPRSGAATEVNAPKLEQVNKQIKKDFYRFVDGPVREAISECEEEVRIWLALEESVELGESEDIAKKRLESQGLQAMTERALGFLFSYDPIMRATVAKEKVIESSRKLHSMAPESARRILEE